jgi:hypothetical protein
METVFKIFLTALVIYFSYGSLKWIWHNQIDVKETGRQFLDAPKKSMDWVATRDDQKIYQEGKVVGAICGAVDISENKIIFKEVCDTELLDMKHPFEYKRDKLKIISYGGIIGIKGIASPDGAISRKAVITDIVCEIIR